MRGSAPGARTTTPGAAAARRRDSPGYAAPTDPTAPFTLFNHCVFTETETNLFFGFNMEKK
ncbi:hypothetical protein, partial [Streptomyces scabiei]|uniref:hypothetical protein n=1 Tax=Streptomyces scabiei TaxID=1930 RepID=UPI0029AABDF0